PVAPEPPAEPVQLTDIADSRRLHLYADGRSAPAPGKALEARHRYTRIEEPLDEDEDKGDRVREEWRYFKSGLPGLGGRLVTEIRVEEVTHTDGSWEFRFERRYQDRGRDRREVRANRDHTYIERKDEVSKIDAETGKRQRYREEAALIFAPPEQEEKRGFLSALLGRDHDDTPAGPSVWRAPSSSERKQARKDGGAAF
ncbi:MAG: hypothetical protein JXQ72_02790, partial [Anaerolineae bacterium]|nr:hypothetical protein [Anaerolineae bacterium]